MSKIEHKRHVAVEELGETDAIFAMGRFECAKCGNRFDVEFPQIIRGGLPLPRFLAKCDQCETWQLVPLRLLTAKIVKMKGE